MTSRLPTSWQSALFIDGLGLDSIDALELGMTSSHKYGIEIDDEDEHNQERFAPVAALARFVLRESSQGSPA